MKAVAVRASVTSRESTPRTSVSERSKSSPLGEQDFGRIGKRDRLPPIPTRARRPIRYPSNVPIVSREEPVDAIHGRGQRSEKTDCEQALRKPAIESAGPEDRIASPKIAASPDVPSMRPTGAIPTKSKAIHRESVHIPRRRERPSYGKPMASPTPVPRIHPMIRSSVICKASSPLVRRLLFPDFP